ncbi:hypothetical protein BJ964_004199 [Actinoplanes lobatus]|uniref:Uncharacterized protein n=1 Tax=Actinoplanes lobatus TaxID=113568 RepID=A0A7W7HGC4_9ACTN|nr:hypothetical protein [Actinoplanes lobatus]
MAPSLTFSTCTAARQGNTRSANGGVWPQPGSAAGEGDGRHRRGRIGGAVLCNHIPRGPDAPAARSGWRMSCSAGRSAGVDRGRWACGAVVWVERHRYVPLCTTPVSCSRPERRHRPRPRRISSRACAHWRRTRWSLRDARREELESRRRPVRRVIGVRLDHQLTCVVACSRSCRNSLSRSASMPARPPALNGFMFREVRLASALSSSDCRSNGEAISRGLQAVGMTTPSRATACSTRSSRVAAIASAGRSSRCRPGCRGHGGPCCGFAVRVQQ